MSTKPKKARKVRTYRVRTDATLAKELDAVVQERGEAASVVIREAIKEYLAKVKEEGG